MSRKQALGLIAAPAALLALGVDTAAAGMKSRVYTHLHLEGDTVHAAGPLDWESDQVSARVGIVIAQGATVAVGLSRRYSHGVDVWSVPVWDEFEHGPATAYATQVSLLKDGSTEFYSWTVPVHLVKGETHG